VSAESDVLKWLSMAEDRPEEKQVRKVRWKMEIRNWLGKSRKGEWIREPVATGVRRVFAKDRVDKDGNAVMHEEIVYANDVYRPNLEGEKKPRRATYWRGARIWIE
jgi:hypothetical protein